MKIVFPEGKIPGSGRVPVSVVPALDSTFIFVSNVRVRGVAGVLARDESIVGHWTFTRSEVGAEVVSVGEQDVQIMDSLDVNDPGFIWVGRNNINQPERILVDIDKMWQLHAATSSMPMWVVSVTPSIREVAGTHGYLNRKRVNAELSRRYGDHYIPLDEYMRNDALVDLGRVATDQDRRDQQNGIIPRSLMTMDGMHFNEAGRRAVARYIAAFVSGHRSQVTTDFSPIGDMVVVGDGQKNINVVGWGFDRGDVGRSLAVQVSVDGEVRTVASAAYPSDYLARYGVWGRHAFVVGVELSTGKHEVCATLVNIYGGSNTSICRTVHGPRASSQADRIQGDVLVYAPKDYGHVTVVGWTFSHANLYQPIDADVYVDGKVQTRLHAGLPSPYLYPYGVPGGHAFLGAIPAADGKHVICVRGVGGNGRSQHLGCSTVRVTSPPKDPAGEAWARATASGLQINGYAYDPSALNEPVTVMVFQGSRLTGIVKADRSTPSLAPYGIPWPHGFSLRVPLISGSTDDVCVLAYNIGAGNHTWLSCFSANLAGGSPLAAVSADLAKDGSMFVSGWAIDHSLQQQALDVTVTVDGKRAANLSAHSEREELSWLFGWKGDHGFYANLHADMQVPHEVCVIAHNIGAPAADGKACKTYRP